MRLKPKVLNSVLVRPNKQPHTTRNIHADQSEATT